MKTIGKKGGRFTRKFDLKSLRTTSGAENIVQIPFATGFSIDQLKKIAAARGPEDGGSTSIETEWGVLADLMVSLTWGQNYGNASASASISSVANYNTWTTTNSQAHYNSQSGEIDFTIYGQVHANVIVQGIGTIQSYNGAIGESYNPTTGESIVNWSF